MKAVKFALFSACLVFFLHSNVQADYEEPDWELYHVKGRCICILMGDSLLEEVWYPVGNFDFTICAINERHATRDEDIFCQEFCFEHEFDLWHTIFDVVEEIAPTCEGPVVGGLSHHLDIQ